MKKLSIEKLGFLNASLYAQMYDRYKSDPTSVDVSWRSFFEGGQTRDISPKYHLEKKSDKSHIRVFNLIQAYRQHGHLLADIDPIATKPKEIPYQLKLETYGLSEHELDEVVPTFSFLKKEKVFLKELIEALQKTYCGKIGVEYVGFHSLSLEQWIQKNIEPNQFQPCLSLEEKKQILQQLNRAELLEHFLHTKYVGQKRFSAEGAETIIPMLSAAIETGANLNVDEFVIGMAHRARLNVLCNILNKSYKEVFSEFDPSFVPKSFEGSGDVKYHKGYSSTFVTSCGKKVDIILSPNPSHLESVDGVVEGMVRAKLFKKGDLEEKQTTIPILIHGDAAIAGQGVVYETLQMQKLTGYSTGGTLHIVINNQIGFTTLPKEGRSTLYCTDIAKAFGSPVFHVNAEDPQECVYAIQLAIHLRQKFHCDVFIDLNCYRKYGHNESDEPAFTQPLEYQIIRKKKTIRQIYRDALIHQGIVERDIANKLEEEFKLALKESLEQIHSLERKEITQDILVDKINTPIIFKSVDTSVPLDKIQSLAEKFCQIPEGFCIHKKVEHLAKERLKMAFGEKPVDWAMAEHLAFASLLDEGVSVRLSGQDCARGTFSQRHAMWMDQKKEKKYFPLQHLSPNQGHFEVFNSPLSEFAVLGFEYGYSSSYLEACVLWEAQFGDFSNGAQIIIDQYIATSEQKWQTRSNLILLLPHGYEGQGPEHSSARIERFLSLCGDHNMVVANPSTPAQYFHLLRRHQLSHINKPLVVFTPKGLLRHPQCVSDIREFTKGSFSEILDDPRQDLSPETLILCSGRIYYDLIKQREEKGVKNTVIIRVEQLYPFCQEKLEKLMDKYKGFKKVLWVQEEPENMGVWDYIRPRIRDDILKGKKRLEYVGRKRSASPATGFLAVHKKELEQIFFKVFGK